MATDLPKPGDIVVVRHDNNVLMNCEVQDYNSWMGNLIAVKNIETGMEFYCERSDIETT